MKHFVTILLAVLVQQVFATHNKAGEIVYRHLNGLSYEITIRTYTSTEPGAADSPTLDVIWGDGSNPQTVGREGITFFPELKAKLNIYKAVHTFTGPGVFTIFFSDRFRNANVVNMDRSVNVAFYTESKVVINPFITSPVGGNNNSVQLLYPPLDQACINEIYYHNPLAYDPDGDSLVFSLIPSRGLNGEQIPSYVFPDRVTGDPDDVMTIDSQSGDLIWNKPKKPGEYNVAIKIEEYRDGILMGHVVRDMQINVRGCSNQAPQFTNVQDTCVLAGSVLNLTVNAIDPDSNSLILKAFGYPFEKDQNKATFNQISTKPALGNFQWATTCDDIRKQRHQVLFRADDQAVPERLVALVTYNITVIAPPPNNPTAISSNESIQLRWDPSDCANGLGYYVYRRIDSSGFTPDFCETGVPEYTEYERISTIEDINDTALLDVNVNFGNKYCYLVTTYFPDGAESYASTEFCGIRSRLDVPVIIKTSVGKTDATIGEDTITWLPPLQLDTLIGFLGPYQYQVSAIDNEDNSTVVFTSPSNTSLSALNTSYVHTNINTKDSANSYKTAVLSNGNVVGNGDKASTHFLSAKPTDNAVLLAWTDNTPWQTDSFFVYRKIGANSFSLIDATTNTYYTDLGLNNGTNYCYYIVGKGRYASLPNQDIWNNSQEVCVKPIDNIIPCAVGLTIGGNCDLEQNTLSWDDANLSCAQTNDVLSYNLYFAPQQGQPLSIFLGNIAGSSNTTFTHTQENTIAGCYGITSIDSLGNQSALSNIVCVDNCPEYKLPNVFTPNGDGVNDTFKPISSKFIESATFTVFNRWGDIVFTSNDLNIGWDGRHKKTGNLVADGVYQYIAEFNKRTINGLVPDKINGYLTVKSGGSK
jgi:gliding motility-associated-like protein